MLPGGDLRIGRGPRGHDHAHGAAAARGLLERHRAADAPGALAHRVDAAVHAAAQQLVLARPAPVVGDAELDAALLERARRDLDVRAAGVLDGVRRRLLGDPVERDLRLAVERVDRARIDVDRDLVRLRELVGELAERRGEAVVAQRDRLERERERAQRADDASCSARARG